MSKRILIAALLSIGLIAGTAASASAQARGNYPSPSPTVTQPTPTPTYTVPPPQPRFVPWQFDLQQSSIGGIPPGLNVNVNNVDSGRTGIIMRNWRDVQITPFIDKFVRGPNSVTLLHDAITFADINVNLRTCSVTLDQDNGRFRIITGTGTGAGFRSINGQFELRGLVSFDLLRNRVCPLVFVSHHALLRALLGNLQVAGQFPSFVDIAVQGRADLVRVQPVHIFAPTAPPTSPTDTESA